MADFSSYGEIDPEFAAVWAAAPKPPQLTPIQLRQIGNETREKASQEEMLTLGSQVTIQDHAIHGRAGHVIEARTYRPKTTPAGEPLPIFLYFHGGGFLMGTLASEDAVSSRIAIATGTMVLNVNYRHTPEHPYPAAWEDAEDAFDWTYKNAASIGGLADAIVIGGISAGAHLTASLVQLKHRQKAASFASIRGQVLMIPALQFGIAHERQVLKLKSPEVSSFEQCKDAPILPVSVINLFGKMLYPDGGEDIDDRVANPAGASAEEVSGLPPSVFGVCGLDPLRDEGLFYAQLLAQNGVPTDVHVFKGLPHGFRRFGDKVAASAAWDKCINDGIRWTLSNPPAAIEIDVHVH